MTTTLPLANLRIANKLRDEYWDPGDVLGPLFFSTELAGELGEACNVVKKLERERLNVPGSRDTFEHLAEELADLIIVTDLLAMKYNIDLSAAVVKKFNAKSSELGFPVYLIEDPSA